MNTYRQYLLLNMLSKLSDEEKREFYNYVLSEKRFADTSKTMPTQLDRIEGMVSKNHHSFLFGVGENVVGNAVYDIGLRLLRCLTQRIT